jgi:hypothetical protein
MNHKKIALAVLLQVKKLIKISVTDKVVMTKNTVLLIITSVPGVDKLSVLDVPVK